MRSYGHLDLLGCAYATTTTDLLLLMLDHYLEPLLKVLLQTHAASFQQVLNSFDLRLQIFQLRILSLVPLLLLINALLDPIFLIRAYKFSVVVNHATKSVLLTDLLHLIGQVFDCLPSLVDICTEILAPGVFFLE